MTTLETRPGYSILSSALTVLLTPVAVAILALTVVGALLVPFLALGMGLVGALQGAGETMSPTVLTTVTMIFIRLPLAWFLLKNYGLDGAWWAMSLSTILQGLCVIVVFRQGRWQKIHV